MYSSSLHKFDNVVEFYQITLTDGDEISEVQISLFLVKMVVKRFEGEVVT